MSFTYLKNPIVLGLIAGIITYGYLYYQADKKYKEEKGTKEQVNILIPCLIAIIVWFMASNYFDNDNNHHNSNNNVSISASEVNVNATPNSAVSFGKKPMLVNGLKGGNQHLSNINNHSSPISEISNAVFNKTFHLIGKNKVRLPPTDVFIDVAKF
jgi:uncharacterized protein with PQ loop repeat